MNQSGTPKRSRSGVVPARHGAIGLYPGALFLAAGGYHHHLGTNVWSSRPPATGDEACLLEWDLVVPQRDDPAAAARSVRAAGYVAEDIDDGCAVVDPWGTRLRIVAPRGRTASGS